MFSQYSFILVLVQDSQPAAVALLIGSNSVKRIDRWHRCKTRWSEVVISDQLRSSDLCLCVSRWINSSFRCSHRLSTCLTVALSLSLVCCVKLTPCHFQCLYKPLGQSAYDWWHCWQSSPSRENIEHGTIREKNIIRWWNSSCCWVFFFFIANRSMAYRSSIVVGVHRGNSVRYPAGGLGVPATEPVAEVCANVIDRCVRCRWWTLLNTWRCVVEHLTSLWNMRIVLELVQPTELGRMQPINASVLTKELLTHAVRRVRETNLTSMNTCWWSSRSRSMVGMVAVDTVCRAMRHLRCSQSNTDMSLEKRFGTTRREKYQLSRRSCPIRQLFERLPWTRFTRQAFSLSSW